MSVVEADFRAQDSMLEAVDKLRVQIESGEIVGFAAVGIMAGGGIWQGHDCFNSQKPALIGALIMKANVFATECACGQMQAALGYD